MVRGNHALRDVLVFPMVGGNHALRDVRWFSEGRVNTVNTPHAPSVI